ncbi:MAG: DUF5717 family protein [Lachnospiraceae bacterium]|nr:DUF5717 family protein [Lachnospiraceae bacterium]
MIKTIEGLLGGNKYEFAAPAVAIDVREIHAETSEGRNYQQKIHIEATDGHRLRGTIVSDHARIVPERDRFSGTDVVLMIGVDVNGLEAGDEVSGIVTLITNVGEFPISVSLKIRNEIVSTSVGTIGSLDDFAVLAEESYQEAYRLFQKSRFEDILGTGDAQYLSLLRGLKNGEVTRRRMEEFLILTGKKQPVEITADKRAVSFFDLKETVQESLLIRKSTWGSLKIAVSVEGEFLEISKHILTEDDFVGSVCELQYLVRADRVRTGVHTGKIHLKSVYSEVILEVTASGQAEDRVSETLPMQYLTADYCHVLIDGRLGKSSAVDTREAAVQLLAERSRYTKDEKRLQLERAAVELIWGSRQCALDILQSLNTDKWRGRDAESRGLIFWLRERLGLSAENENTAARISYLYNEHSESLLLLFLHMETDSALRRMPYQRMRLMQEAYESGCRSPLLYTEAYLLLRQDDSLLMRMTPFSRAVLTFAVHHGEMTEALAVRTAYLSDNEKHFSVPMLRILKGSYEMYPLDSVLEALCRMAIKGTVRNEISFPWYEEAVEKNLRITRLYEAYVEAMPKHFEQRLPAAIRKYFVWNDTISDDRRAVIYANIIRNRCQDPATFDAYREDMEGFARKALASKRIGREYAVIYQAMIRQVKDTAMAEALSDAAFTVRVFCDREDVRRIIVHHGELREEEVYSVRRGEAYIRRYTEDAVILFEDQEGNRFLSPVEYTLEPLMDRKQYLGVCESFAVDTPGFLLYVCRQEEEIGITNLEAYRNAAVSDAFSEEFHRKVGRNLLAYYAENAGADTLDNFLSEMDISVFPQEAQANITELLVERGKYAAAFRLVRRFGMENVDQKALIRLASRITEQYQTVEEEDVLYLALHVFRLGKYDDQIMEYLVRFFSGSLGDMLEVREKAAAFGTETFLIDERILLQAMFTHTFIPEGPKLFREYFRSGGSRKTVYAYLTFASIWYFMTGEKVDRGIAGIIAEFYANQAHLDLVLRLALLLYYSQKESLSQEEEFRVESLLEEFAAKGLRFRYFQDLPKSFLRRYQLEDKVFIEQSACVEDKVTLRYLLSSDPDQKWRREPMQRKYRGVFVKEFVLLYGEELTYRISVTHNGQETVTEERTTKTRFIDMKGRNSYQMINQMLWAKEKGDEQELREKLREYLRAVKRTEALFSLEDEP